MHMYVCMYSISRRFAQLFPICIYSILSGKSSTESEKTVANLRAAPMTHVGYFFLFYFNYIYLMFCEAQCHLNANLLVLGRG